MSLMKLFNETARSKGIELALKCSLPRVNLIADLKFTGVLDICFLS
jgi:hypothetical protein